jgi:tetratricopeptide (TPR) repeat protein
MKQIRASVLFFAIFVTMLSGYLFPNSAAAQKDDYWVGRIVSVQGSVQVQRAGAAEWVPVILNDTYAFGDTIRIQEQSRAAVILRNEVILRLDQNTTITFSASEQKETSLLNLLNGAAHFFSPTPRKLKVTTPFVNAAVGGTEFFIRVEGNQTLMSVFEGRVVAINEAGSLILASGQSAIARTGQAPVSQVVVRPRDAVQWALYYPPVLDYRPADFGSDTGWQAKVRRSIQFYWNGDLTSAFAGLKGVPEDIQGPRFFTYRAGLFLAVGCVDEAGVDIKKALNLDPSNSQAIALQSIIAVVQNQRDQAVDLAKKAVALAPESPAARVALSYAQQADFDLQGALFSLREAVELGPGNALAWSRLSELWLSFGDLDKALEAANKAVVLNPNIVRTQTVLGFSYLTQIKIRDAKNAFENAIELDQAAPLPRLGLGLAKIRDGDLKQGRREIEIAASLDPDNSLIRSYLGKAYYEEKREKQAQNQFAMARELDPQDPTAWFYEAILKQSQNRPVEALEDLQKSIELNDNRAVYRSRLMLDKDLAARSASLAGIYDDLGFQQLALVEGLNSVNADPANYSAHRFLADSYANLPRHGIARASELLQSQLLQPINVTPVPPSLAESSLFILEGAGPSDPSFNEFNPLFERDRLALQASGVAGGNSILGDELIQSGLQGRFSYSLGQFYYETDGFRKNNDQDQNIYNAFAQAALSHKTSIQAEYRYTDLDAGDLLLKFRPTEFSNSLRQESINRTLRLGLHHAFNPRSDLIASVSYWDGDLDIYESFHDEFFGIDGASDFDIDSDGYMAEIQHMFHSSRFSVTSGLGYFNADSKHVEIMSYSPDFFMEDTTTIHHYHTHHTNLYVYSLINYPQEVTWTIGGSADFFRGGTRDLDHNQLNPKLGLTWNPFSGTTLRASAFRTLTRTLISNQTLEPTQVAGFNQFFAERDGTESRVYGIGVDQELSSVVYGGVEFVERDMDVIFFDLNKLENQETDWEENLARVYLYWTPRPWLATSVEYQYERFERRDEFIGPDLFYNIKTQRVPLGINFFHPSGFIAGLKATYVDQKGKFRVLDSEEETPDDDQFWVVDASIGFRLPKRRGLVTIEVRNLFDESFKFQDTDTVSIEDMAALPLNPQISPECLILAKVTLNF